MIQFSMRHLHSCLCFGSALFTLRALSSCLTRFAFFEPSYIPALFCNGWKLLLRRGTSITGSCSICTYDEEHDGEQREDGKTACRAASKGRVASVHCPSRGVIRMQRYEVDVKAQSQIGGKHGTSYPQQWMDAQKRKRKTCSGYLSSKLGIVIAVVSIFLRNVWFLRSHRGLPEGAFSLSSHRNGSAFLWSFPMR